MWEKTTNFFFSPLHLTPFLENGDAELMEVSIMDRKRRGETHSLEQLPKFGLWWKKLVNM